MPLHRSHAIRVLFSNELLLPDHFDIGPLFLFFHNDMFTLKGADDILFLNVLLSQFFNQLNHFLHLSKDGCTLLDCCRRVSMKVVLA